MYTVKLLTEAEIDLTDACKWYEKKQRGLAKRFLEEVNYYLKLIAEDPLRYPIRFSLRYRYATLKVFPFLISFRIEDGSELIYIISIFHTSRNPENL